VGACHYTDYNIRFYRLSVSAHANNSGNEGRDRELVDHFPDKSKII